MTRPVKHFVLLQLQTRFSQWSTRLLIPHNSETPNPNPQTIHPDPFSESAQEPLANHHCGTCTFFAYIISRRGSIVSVCLKQQLSSMSGTWGRSRHPVEILPLNFKLHHSMAYPNLCKKCKL